MATNIINSHNYGSNVCFSDYFQKQNRNILLLTHFRSQDSFFDVINSYILERFIELDLQNTLWNDLNSRLKKFFVDLNWELNARFRTTVDLEKGVSVLIVVVEGANILYVSSGRFICGVLQKDNNQEFIDKFSSYHVKTPEQLGLLGSLEADIVVRPIPVELKEGCQFIACSSDAVGKINPSSLHIYNTNSTFLSLFETTPLSYCLIDYVPDSKGKKKAWYQAKKFRFTVIAMLLTLIFSVFYLFRGGNTVEDRLNITREQFQLTVRNIDFLKIQEMLPLDYGLLFVPQRNIELFVEWESVLPFVVTLAPNYDLRQIFLSSNNKIYAYDKRDKKNTWIADFPQNIISVEILEANLMVVTTIDYESYCLKRDSGDIVWERKGIVVDRLRKNNPYKPIQVSLEMDRRLNNSVVLFPDKNGLTLLNILNGDTLYHYESDSMINYISDFDVIDKSIYLVQGNRLSKVRFDIKT